MTLSTVDLLEDRVRAILDALPDTADGIAEKLTGLGIRAVCGDPRRCALAEHLLRELGDTLPEGLGVGVTGPYLYVGPLGAEGLDTLFDLPTPAAAYEFVGRFDSHDYPDLEAPDDELAHVVVGDPPACGDDDGPADCPASTAVYLCTRDAGHPGQHIADGTSQVWAVWTDDAEATP